MQKRVSGMHDFLLQSIAGFFLLYCVQIDKTYYSTYSLHFITPVLSFGMYPKQT